MDQYPNLAHVRQILEQYATIDKVLQALREEKKLLRLKMLLPGKRVLTWNEIQKFEETYHFVEKEVEGRYWDSGEPGISHLLGTTVIALFALEVRNIDELMADLTHDLIEDFPLRWANHYLREYTSSEAASIVQVNTRDRITDRDKDEKNDAYYGHVADREVTARCKLCDGLHNQITLPGFKQDLPPRERLVHLKRKMIEAESKLLAIARRYDILVKELEEAIQFNWIWIRDLEQKERSLETMGSDRDF